MSFAASGLMGRWSWCARACVALLILGASSGATDAPKANEEKSERVALRFDPFVVRSKTSSGAKSSGHFTPVLRATLISRRNSLANLGGQILRLGEESHGYRLVAVREGEAEFETEGGGRVVLVVIDESTGEHE